MFTDPSRARACRPGPRRQRVRATGPAGWPHRREWEQANGISLQDWFDELLEETLEAGATLAEVNMAFSAYLTEPGDWSDPRLSAA